MAVLRLSADSRLRTQGRPLTVRGLTATDSKPSFDCPRTHGHGLRAVLRRAVDPRLAAGVADGPAGKQRVPAPDRDGLGPEDHLSEDAAEALVEAQINDEVDGRVGDDERVAHAAEVELEAAAEPRRVGQEVPRQLGDERRELTHAEHDDDDDQDERDVIGSVTSSG